MNRTNLVEFIFNLEIKYNIDISYRYKKRNRILVIQILPYNYSDSLEYDIDFPDDKKIYHVNPYPIDIIKLFENLYGY